MKIAVAAALCLTVVAVAAANQRKGCAERGGECKSVEKGDQTCQGGVQKLDCPGKDRCCLPKGDRNQVESAKGQGGKKSNKPNGERSGNGRPPSRGGNGKDDGDGDKDGQGPDRPRSGKGSEKPRHGRKPSQSPDKPRHGRKPSQSPDKPRHGRKPSQSPDKPRHGRKPSQSPDKPRQGRKPNQNGQGGGGDKPRGGKKPNKGGEEGNGDKRGEGGKETGKRFNGKPVHAQENSGQGKPPSQTGKDGGSIRQSCRVKKQCKQLKGKCQSASAACKGQSYTGNKFCTGSCSCCVKTNQLCRPKNKCKKRNGTCQFKWDVCNGQMLKKACKGSSSACVCCAPKSCKDKNNLCSAAGGSCVLKEATCPGQVDSSLCGKFCQCCLENQGEQTVLQPGDNTPTLQIDDNGPTLPASLVLNVNLDDVHFLLWTRSNSDNDADYELVIDDVSNLKASPFDGTKPTVILCHGWNSEGTASWIYRAKTEFLQWQDINFISVEWSSIARHINYLEVVNNIPKIGKHIAAFIDYLYKEGGLNVTDLYVAGHSLGAHVVGIAGLNVQNGPVGRITGLDPAGPGFEGASDDVRLDKSDAAFVDVIHTSACPQSKICLGLSGSFGHVDFFPNGGGSQPGCEVLGPVGDALSGCSHKRAYEYWTESVNGVTKFKSVPCPDWNSFRAGNCVACGQGCLNMGVHVDKQLRGDYYLETNANRPYAKG